jgi:CheY-like chemotaxis protein
MPLSSLNVLYADDSAVHRKVVLSMLRAFNCEIVEVENGFEALGAMKARPFDVILMDQVMPGLDGLEAIRRIRKIESGDAGRRRAAIAVLSSNYAPADLDASHLAGADLHLAKPIRAQILLSGIQTALRASRAGR